MDWKGILWPDINADRFVSPPLSEWMIYICPSHCPALPQHSLSTTYIFIYLHIPCSTLSRCQQVRIWGERGSGNKWHLWAGNHTSFVWSEDRNKTLHEAFRTEERQGLKEGKSPKAAGLSEGHWKCGWKQVSFLHTPVATAEVSGGVEEAQLLLTLLVKFYGGTLKKREQWVRKNF